MNKKALVSSAFLLSFAVTGVTFAQSAKAVEIKQRIAEKKEKNAVKSCEIVTGRVENRITVFEENKEKHLTSYLKVTDKIKKFVDRLENKDYDVSTLKVDLVELDSKIEKFENDYATYISLLRDSKQYSCARSEGEFKAKLQAAREQLKVVHQDSVEIRTYFAKTVRPHILEIKDQKPQTGETDETKTEETENEEESNE